MKLTLSSKFDSNLRGFVPSQSLRISLFLPQRTFNDETTNCKFDRSNKAFFAITNARRFTFREKAGTLISRRFDGYCTHKASGAEQRVLVFVEPMSRHLPTIHF